MFYLFVKTRSGKLRLVPGVSKGILEDEVEYWQIPHDALQDEEKLGMMTVTVVATVVCYYCYYCVIALECEYVRVPRVRHALRSHIFWSSFFFEFLLNLPSSQPRFTFTLLSFFFCFYNVPLLLIHLLVVFWDRYLLSH